MGEISLRNGEVSERWDFRCKWRNFLFPALSAAKSVLGIFLAGFGGLYWIRNSFREFSKKIQLLAVIVLRFFWTLKRKSEKHFLKILALNLKLEMDFKKPQNLKLKSEKFFGNVGNLNWKSIKSEIFLYGRFYWASVFA